MDREDARHGDALIAGDRHAPHRSACRLGDGARASVLLNTSISSRGLAGPMLTKAMRSPERIVCSPSSRLATCAVNRPGRVSVRATLLSAPLGAVRVTGSAVSFMVCRSMRMSRPLSAGAKGFLLQGRLLHEPVGEAAQQIEMRSAVLVAARPEPGVIGEKQRDAALVLAAQHEERQVVRARHQGRARLHLRADDAQPLAPGGRLTAPSPAGRGSPDGGRPYR